MIGLLNSQRFLGKPRVPRPTSPLCAHSSIEIPRSFRCYRTALGGDVEENADAFVRTGVLQSVLGKVVAELVNTEKEAGQLPVQFNASNF